MRSSLLLLLLAQVAPPLYALLCYDARDVSLFHTFSRQIYSAGTNDSWCYISALYDDAPATVVSVSMHADQKKKVPALPGTVWCRFRARRYPKSKQEKAMQLRAYDQSVYECRCNEDYCNVPELIMDHLGHSKHSLVSEYMERIREASAPKPFSTTSSYKAFTGALLAIGALILLLNLVYVSVEFVRHWGLVHRHPLFNPMKSKQQ